MLLIVKTPWVGHGFNMPNPGSLIEANEALANHLVGIGCCVPYETKVEAPPAEIKKNGPSESLPADPAPPKRTRKNSKRSATKR